MSICGGSKLAASTSPSRSALSRAPKPPMFTVLMFSSGIYLSSRYGTLKWLPARIPTAICISRSSSGFRILESGRTNIDQGEMPKQSGTIKPMPALALLIVPHKHAHWITCSPTALSCGRSKYSIPFQLDCVPRKVFQSNSTSRPSALKKPSSNATKSFRPIPFGATWNLGRSNRGIAPARIPRLLDWKSKWVLLEYWDTQQDLHRYRIATDLGGPERPLRQCREGKRAQLRIRTLLNGNLLELSLGIDDRVHDNQAARIFSDQIDWEDRRLLGDREWRNDSRGVWGRGNQGILQCPRGEGHASLRPHVDKHGVDLLLREYSQIRQATAAAGIRHDRHAIR